VNVLFLTHPDADHGAAFLYNGLRLNGHTVYDYPRKGLYHDPPAKDAIAWVGWMGGYDRPVELVGDPFDGTDERDQVYRALEKGVFDLVVLESSRHGAATAMRDLQGAISDANVPVVLHDGEDVRDYPVGLMNEARHWFGGFRAVLKREVPKAEGLTGTVDGVLRVAFPFSGPDQILGVGRMPHHLRPFDVFGVFGGTHPDRMAVVRALRQAAPADDRVVGIHPDPDGDPENAPYLPWKGFTRLACMSRVGVSCQGAGVDTCRYWELPLCGCLLLADDVDLAIPYPFEDGKTAWFYPVPEAVRVWAPLGRDERAAAVAGAGFEHAKRHHTNSARVRWMLEILRERGAISC
jgi:hypothetical protein